MHTNPDSGQAEQTKVGFQELGASREEEARRLSFSKNIDGKSPEKYIWSASFTLNQNEVLCMTKSAFLLLVCNKLNILILVKSVVTCIARLWTTYNL